MRGKCIRSNVSFHLLSEWIVIGWASMYDVNTLPPLSLIRALLTRQLIYKSKTEKHNVSLDIFISDTSIARNLPLPEFEKKHFSYFFEDQCLIIKVKRYLHGMDEICIIVYEKNPSKARSWLPASAIRFIL